MFTAAGLLGLDTADACLVSSSSRLVWRLPRAGAALFVTRSATKTRDQVLGEVHAVEAARDAGVRTPRPLGTPVDLPGQRFATAYEWVPTTGHPAPVQWVDVVGEAVRVASATTVALPGLTIDSAASPDSWTAVLDERLADDFGDVLAHAAATVADLVAQGPLVLCHGDLQPANAVVDTAGATWLLDFEYACAAPLEWDAAKVSILANRFGDPERPGPLLAAWGDLDPGRLRSCIAAQEAQLVVWLVRMALTGNAGAAAEARCRARTLVEGDRARWQHLR